MTKEVSIKFEDGEYIVKDGGGDSILGTTAHTIMHRMNQATNYKELPFRQRVDFIILAAESDENLVIDWKNFQPTKIYVAHEKQI